MKRQALTPFAILMTLVAALCVAVPAQAAPEPSSDLLLPYFEVDLNGGLTTLFSLVNSDEEAVTARISVFSNWGIEVLSESILLDPDEVRTINLADWLIFGNLPNKALRGEDLQHVQAALTGEASLKSGLYYSSRVNFELAVGYIEIRVTSAPRKDALWGDYFVVDPLQDFAQGEILVDIDRARDCGSLCLRRALRFLSGGGFDGGTEVIVWTGRRGVPTPNGTPNNSNATETKTAVYNEQGDHIDDRFFEFRPVEVLTVAELGLAEPFGWLDVQAEIEFFMAVRYSANNRFSVGLVSHCLPIKVSCTTGNCGDGGEEEDPKIRLEKATNGVDADNAPGVNLQRDEAVEWTYRVTNIGKDVLSDIEVTDDDPSLTVDCPRTTLQPGASMICIADGSATAKNYRNLGTVEGYSPKGTRVTDDDPSNYNTPDPEQPENPRIDIEKATNGHDADNAPGIKLDRDQAVTWTYVVKNTGDVALSTVTVTDDDSSLTVNCPKSALAVDETMTCTATGTAHAKNYRNLGTAKGTSPKGKQVTDEDPSNYNTPDPEQPENPRIDIEKATNGHDADNAPGIKLDRDQAVTWTYVVKNTGDVALSTVTVTDDDSSLTVNCPKSALAVGASMTCTATGTAHAKNYRNLGTAKGTSPKGKQVTDEDPSNYNTPDPPVECGACDGKITTLTLQFLGDSAAHVEVIAKRGGNGNDTVYSATLNPGDTFTVVGPASGNGGFAGTLGTEIRFYIDGGYQTFLHTSCSAPVGPGTIAGSFLVLEGASKNGGNLCPM